MVPIMQKVPTEVQIKYKSDRFSSNPMHSDLFSLVQYLVLRLTVAGVRHEDDLQNIIFQKITSCKTIY